MARGRDALNSETKRIIVGSVFYAYGAAALAAGITNDKPNIFTAPCLWCGEATDRRLSATDPARGEAGHGVPDADGGDYSIDNLHPTCRVCNVDAEKRNPFLLWATAYPVPTVERLDRKFIIAAHDAANDDVEVARRRAKRKSL